MSSDNAQVIDRFWAAFANADVPTAMALFHDEATYEDLGARHLARGKAEIAAFWNMFFANVSRENFKPVCDAVILGVDGRYATEWTMEFRLTGSFGPVKGTGQLVKFRGASVGKITHGLIEYNRDYWDSATTMEQLRVS